MTIKDPIPLDLTQIPDQSPVGHSTPLRDFLHSHVRPIAAAVTIAVVTAVSLFRPTAPIAGHPTIGQDLTQNDGDPSKQSRLTYPPFAGNSPGANNLIEMHATRNGATTSIEMSSTIVIQSSEPIHQTPPLVAASVAVYDETNQMVWSANCPDQQLSMGSTESTCDVETPPLPRGRHYQAIGRFEVPGVDGIARENLQIDFGM